MSSLAIRKYHRSDQDRKSDLQISEDVFRKALEQILLENFTVMKVKKNMENKKFTFFKVTPQDLEKNVKLTFKTHFIMIPSINLFWFPRKHGQMILSFFQYHECSQSFSKMMNQLVQTSGLFETIIRVYKEKGLSLQPVVYPDGTLELKIYAK